MKTLALILLTIGLSACSLLPERIVTVTVDKPIPYSPAPPDVPACANYVDALVQSDATDPGKVAQAYKLDMTCYRANDKTFRRILDGYRDISTQNGSVDKMLIDVSRVIQPSPAK